MDDLDVYERASCLGLVEVTSIYYVPPLNDAQKFHTASFLKPSFKLETYWLMSCNCDVIHAFPLRHKSV